MPVSSTKAFRSGAAAFAAALVVSCARPQPLDTVEQVDLDRFMGRWYVLASIPTFLERGSIERVPQRW